MPTEQEKHPQHLSHQFDSCESCNVNPRNPAYRRVHCHTAFCIDCVQTDSQRETTCPSCLVRSDNASYEI